jgi:predicted Zn-dependent peptidase
MTHHKDQMFFDTLPNGVQLIGETFENVQSVSIGFFFKSGVLYEDPKNLGVSHFIEHMMFKGTHERSARDIARQFDRIGGYLNAFTAKDYCCYYARVVKDKVPVAIEILADMVKDSVFDKAELERERGVILEEIKMYEDSPDEIIHELLGQTLWQKSALGRPILGTAETVGGMSRQAILAVYESQYVCNNMLVCMAGNYDRGEFHKLLKKHLTGLRSGALKHKKASLEPFYEISLFQKEIEQVHLALGCPGTNYADEYRYAATVLNTAFGGGMSSRLFQEIREKRGLAYSVFSYHTSFRDSGFFSIYAGTSIEHLEKVLALMHAELEKVSRRGLTKVELKEALDQLKGNLLIALESTTNRMNRLVSGFLYGVKPVTPEESIAPLLKVTSEDVQEIATKLMNEKTMAMTLISSSDTMEKILKNSPFSPRPIHSQPLGQEPPKKQEKKKRR